MGSQKSAKRALERNTSNAHLFSLLRTTLRYPFIAKTGIKPRVSNVVSMFNLGTKLNLKHIALHAKNAEYNPKRFAAVIMRIREPKVTQPFF